MHTEKLELLMRQLDRFDRKLMPKEIDAETERLQRRHRIAELADEIAISAYSIPDMLEGVALSEEHYAEFMGYVGALEERAKELGETARASVGEPLSPKLDALNATCTACHDRFRVLPRAR